MNLTLASPSVNRHQKVKNDVVEWVPELNQSWYVDRITQVRLEYGLTIDRDEADAIDTALATCDSTEMVVLAPTNTGVSQTTATPTPTPAAGVDALAMYNDNGNGGITCAEARAPRHRAGPTADTRPTST